MRTVLRGLVSAACVVALVPCIQANPYSGTIKSLDPNTRNLVVVIDSKPEVFHVRKDAKLTIHGKPGELADLKPGLAIRLSCEPRTRVIAELIAKVAPPPPPPPPPSPPPVRPLNADGLQVGASGSPERISGKVMQVIDGSQMLVGIEDSRTGDGRYSTWVMVKCSTAGITDGKFFGTGWKDVVGSSVLKVTGTTTYKTAGGSTKTVFVLEPVRNP